MDALSTYWPGIEPELREELEQGDLYRTIPAQTVLLRQGSYVAGLPWVLSGRIKVVREGEEKDLLLYYIRPGESCIMSFQACLHDQKSGVAAVTEEDTEILLIPTEKVPEWLLKYPSFHQFVFHLYQIRYNDLISTIDQLIFHRLDERLLHYLQQQATLTGNRELSLTHQQIAGDLGSSREVISRVLKKLEQMGTLSLSRHTITLSE